MYKVGDKVAPWQMYNCGCGSDYYITRMDPKVLTEDDLLCSSCIDYCNHEFELDILRKEKQELVKSLTGMIEIAEELNYRLHNTDDGTEGFHTHIGTAKDLLREIG